MKVIANFIMVTFSIIGICAFLGLFVGEIDLNLHSFWNNCLSIFDFFLDPYQDLVHPYTKESFNLFPGFWSYYIYSVIIFCSSLLLAFLLGNLLTFITILLPKKVSERIVYIVTILEALPDIFIIIVIQFSVVQIFKNTGVLLFPVAGAFEKAYFLPIVTLSILPLILFFKISVLLNQDEYQKTYVEFGLSKGLSNLYLLFVHIFRNTLVSLYNHAKSINWVMLSNLVMFERLFNIYGITYVILIYPNIEVIAFCLVLFFVPIYLLLNLYRFFINQLTNEKVNF
ncbi:hypothetical protein ABE65_011525 [Fictibacillus phosphorivorans]|uniref:ABC transmembrane type-1 domain-containing protein n=1 Tax=Fictibacillus phosphorivorans TaxID=1221500 RepID=A0A160IMZ4_9BACL|nr:hypothetical protein [Fictibacillus phosphorivorans]ANC77397.1 hypothetical protein ABE65_011525 [Fictibacillus phosphorivorans]